MKQNNHIIFTGRNAIDREQQSICRVVVLYYELWLSVKAQPELVFTASCRLFVGENRPPGGCYL